MYWVFCSCSADASKFATIWSLTSTQPAISDDSAGLFASKKSLRAAQPPMIAACGKNAEASTILRAFGTFCFTVTSNGTHSATAGTAPETNEVTASAMRWLTSCTSLVGSRFAERSARSRKTCAVVPVVVEICLPFRSASDLIASSRTQSWAVAYSMLLTRKTLPWPRAGKLETTAPVDSTSRLPPIIAWNSSRPVVNWTSSRSKPRLVHAPDCWPSQIWPSTAGVCR